jgi:hypothetical protein
VTLQLVVFFTVIITDWSQLDVIDNVLEAAIKLNITLVVFEICPPVAVTFTVNEPSKIELHDKAHEPGTDIANDKLPVVP